MPEITDTLVNNIPESAKDAAYTAVGLPVLVLDQVRDRFAPARKVADKQLDIAREHATDASNDWQKQFDSITNQLRDLVPANIGSLDTSNLNPASLLPDAITNLIPANVASFIPGLGQDEEVEAGEVIKTAKKSTKKAAKSTKAAAKKTSTKTTAKAKKTGTKAKKSASAKK